MSPGTGPTAVPSIIWNPAPFQPLLSLQIKDLFMKKCPGVNSFFIDGSFQLL